MTLSTLPNAKSASFASLNVESLRRLARAEVQPHERRRLREALADGDGGPPVLTASELKLGVVVMAFGALPASSNR